MFKLKCSLALHCHSLGMVVIALCHTSSSNAGADVLEQLNDDDGRMFVVRNWDVTSLGAAEVAQREVLLQSSHLVFPQLLQFFLLHLILSFKAKGCDQYQFLTQS